MESPKLDSVADDAYYGDTLKVDTSSVLPIRGVANKNCAHGGEGVRLNSKHQP